ncbi:MAG TPA: hypothetical protein VEW46_18675 [Pyrinomonadaceae bacterium]|nr:hypothetical protein [Pyrinomonadaceae bacterium]
MLRTNGWDPSDFEWRDVQGYASNETISKPVHKSSGHFFSFDNGEGNVYSSFSPGAQKTSESANLGEFDAQLTGWLFGLAI